MPSITLRMKPNARRRAAWGVTAGGGHRNGGSSVIRSCRQVRRLPAVDKRSGRDYDPKSLAKSSTERLPPLHRRRRMQPLGHRRCLGIFSGRLFQRAGVWGARGSRSGTHDRKCVMAVAAASPRLTSTLRRGPIRIQHGKNNYCVASVIARSAATWQSADSSPCELAMTDAEYYRSSGIGIVGRRPPPGWKRLRYPGTTSSTGVGVMPRSASPSAPGETTLSFDSISN